METPPLSKNIVLLGLPRVGKTTVVQKVLSLVKVRCGGFFTQATNKAEFYTNFRIVTVHGKHRELSEQNLIRRFDIPNLLGFNLEDLERRGNPSVERALQTCDVVVVDQLGTLEMMSAEFRRVVETVLDSPKVCLATMTHSDDPFLKTVRERPDVVTYPVNTANRSVLPDQVALHIRRICRELNVWPARESKDPSDPRSGEPGSDPSSNP